MSDPYAEARYRIVRTPNHGSTFPFRHLAQVRRWWGWSTLDWWLHPDDAVRAIREHASGAMARSVRHYDAHGRELSS